MATLEQEVKYVYNSNRLDGVHVPYERTLELCETPPDPLDDSVDLVGMDQHTQYARAVVLSHMQALLFVEQLGGERRRYVESDVREIHRRLMEGVILSGGEYRECTLNYRAVPPVAPLEIPRRIRRVVDIMNAGLERAGASPGSQPSDGQRSALQILSWQVHHEFLYVHPFIEGNGRTARLLLNLVRFRGGLDLEVIPFAEHERYLRSLVEYGKKLAASSGAPPSGAR